MGYTSKLEQRIKDADREIPILRKKINDLLDKKASLAVKIQTSFTLGTMSEIDAEITECESKIKELEFTKEGSKRRLTKVVPKLIEELKATEAQLAERDKTGFTAWKRIDALRQEVREQARILQKVAQEFEELGFRYSNLKLEAELADDLPTPQASEYPPGKHWGKSSGNVWAFARDVDLYQPIATDPI